jgi:predicted CXXCH cytochrome family protein
MKTSITSIAKLAGGLTLMAASSFASASVVNTAHNLGTNAQSNTGGARFSGTTEICIFCHTPHGGDQSVAAPIWNRTVSSTGVYTRFSAMNRITFDADEAPIGSVSIACLSCHDGTQARDAVINSPGSNSIGSANELGGGTWMDGTNTATAFLSSLNASDNGVMGDMIYLGTDLRNDHPISMQYGGGGISTTATNGATRDIDFAQAGTVTGGFGMTATSHATTSLNAITGVGTGAVVYLASAGGPKWYVDTGGTGYQGSDFPLYTRTDGPASPGVAQPFVECATCHDPHSSNSTFLRLPNGNKASQVCLTCHAK